MNVRNLFVFLLVSSVTAACGESTVDDDQPADPESGLETVNSKDDSFAVRPDSPEAQAVVDYLNQPLADDAAGEAYRVELDSFLYRRAADNIAAYRAGDDGTFGTADDLQFDTITEVDAIPFVGRSSLMRLLEVAEAEGYFQRASVDCADYLPHDRWNNYSVDSYADLLEVENSRCTTIKGNLNIHIRGTDLLPPSARAVDHLRYLVTVDGNVTITTTEVFESMHFDSLETVTGTLTARGPGEHTLEFDSLTGAESVTLENIETATFPALEYNANIYLNESDYTGFTALGSAGRIRLHQRTEGTFEIDFPALVEAEQLQIDVPRANRWTTPDVTFEGGFSVLEHLGSLTINEGKYGSFEWAALKSVDNLRTKLTFDIYAGMDALQDVGNLVSYEDHNNGGAHAGPANLKTVGSMSVHTKQGIEGGYPALTTVESNITVTTDYGVTGFQKVETVGGNVSLNIGRLNEAVELSGFDSAVTVGGIMVNANNTQVTVGEFFPNLEFTDSNVSLLRNARFDVNPVFSSLLGIGGQLRIDSLRTTNPMPVLEIVDGDVHIDYSPQVFTGFDKLGHIEGTLTLRRGIKSIDGFGVLTSLGGNLVVSRDIDSVELDDFLNQLEEFSGTISLN